jgi:predicted Zn-ribbon and HTH transcriptional regulator
MKISNLVKQLTAIQFQYGDMDVTMEHSGGSVLVTEIEACYKENEYGRMARLSGEQGNSSPLKIRKRATCLRCWNTFELDPLEGLSDCPRCGNEDKETFVVWEVPIIKGAGKGYPLQAVQDEQGYHIEKRGIDEKL